MSSVFACRKRWKKSDAGGDLLQCGSEFIPIGSIPGNNGIKALQRRYQTGRRLYIRQTEQIQASPGNRADPIRESNQRNDARRNPDLGVVCPQELHRRQRQNAIADGAGPNDQPSQTIIITDESRFVYADFTAGGTAI